MKLTGNTSIFGTRTRTNILFALAIMGESHAAELSRIIDADLSTVQNAVESLEEANLVSATLVGRNRRLRLNPRYVARDELKVLLDRLAPQNKELVKRIGELRRRPRRAGKDL